ncbi:TIGR02757 family protein [Deferrisoma camini]|uniref:TIGR02757 family protein n=1 Tax=Deferrisoma camini TaxID=1035120 RepID=UPI00046CD912|nr:TIGR02757 family protein [Deferrisoma camini]
MARPARSELERLYAAHHRPEFLWPDPLVFARGWADPRDGEVAALVAAAFAYGRVEKILEALGEIFGHLGDRPREALGRVAPREWQERLGGFAYRFHKGGDVAVLLHLVAQALERWGTLADLFERSDPGDDLKTALSRFSQAVLGGDPRPLLREPRLPPRHPVRHLLASPATGGAAKRMCLFLRWVVRRDALDPGYWHGRVDPARLVVPLDAHVARVGRALGFTARKSNDWKTAVEITHSLAAYDPADPVRFDFSLFRFGMGRYGPGSVWNG